MANLTQEELQAKRDEIQQRIDGDTYTTAEDGRKTFAMVTQLEKAGRGQGAPYFAQLYKMGWGCGKDLDKSLEYSKIAARLFPEDGKIWYTGGETLTALEKPHEAIDWYKKAEQYGVSGAAASVAFSYWYEASLLNNAISDTFDLQAYTHAMPRICALQQMAFEKYWQVAHQKDSHMDFFEWCVFANCPLLLMGHQVSGETNMKAVDGFSLKNLTNASMDMMEQRGNADQLEDCWQRCMKTAVCLEQYDLAVLAEEVRAGACLYRSKAEKSAEIFYRARYHLKRVEELLAQRSKDDQDSMDGSFPEADALFEELNKKYDRYLRDMAAHDQLPDVEEEYPEGEAPRVTDSEGFLQLKISLTKAPAPAQNTLSGGLGSLLGGLLGFKR